MVVERALTIFLNSQEIVTAMTIGDYPEYLALGFLLNQNMLKVDDVVTSIDYDEDLAVVVVRTKRKTNYEKKLKKVRQTLGKLQQDPRHPGLNSHKYNSIQGVNGEDIWECYVENSTPSAWRMFWHYGPGKAVITLVTIGPHP